MIWLMCMGRDEFESGSHDTNIVVNIFTDFKVYTIKKKT